MGYLQSCACLAGWRNVVDMGYCLRARHYAGVSAPVETHRHSSGSQRHSDLAFGVVAKVVFRTEPFMLFGSRRAVG